MFHNAEITNFLLDQEEIPLQKMFPKNFFTGEVFSYSIVVPCILFDFRLNGNYRTIDFCFLPYNATSLDTGYQNLIVQLTKQQIFFLGLLIIQLSIASFNNNCF